MKLSNISGCFLGALLAILPSRSKAEPQPANVSTAAFVLNITPGQFSSFSAERMVALADGTRLVLGSGADNSINAQFLLKVNANGTQAWAIPVADPFTAVFTGLAADAAGNAYVAYTDFSNFAEPHARIVKFNASGSETARADLATDTAGGDGFPFSAGIAVDPIRGRVYATHLFFSSTHGQDTFAVTAFDTALQRVAGPLIHDPGFTGSFIGPDPKGGTLVDGSGQVWVTGLRLVPGASSAELFAAHYGPNLTGGGVTALPSWSAEEVGATADPRGGVVVAGDRPIDDNLYLHRVTAGGFGPAFRFEGFDFVPSPMAVDPAGSLYIVGFNPTTFLPAVVKINASNGLAWDQPGPYLDLPDTLSLGAVAVASSTTFDLAGVAFNVNPSPVVLLHYQASSAVTHDTGGRLSIAAGNEPTQVGAVGRNLPLPLTAAVRDSNGAALVGVGVSFSISSSPAGATGHRFVSSDTMTAVDGRAAAVFRLGSVPADYGVSCACPTCEAGVSTVTFKACGKLATDEFRQGDNRWRTQVLGSHPPANSIGAVGCALTSMANLFNFFNQTSTL